MALFPYSSQQWLNTECIEHIEDLGWDINVTLKTGKVCRVTGDKRTSFFETVGMVHIKPGRDPSEPDDDMELIRSIVAGRKPDGLYGPDAC